MMRMGLGDELGGRALGWWEAQWRYSGVGTGVGRVGVGKVGWWWRGLCRS